MSGEVKDPKVVEPIDPKPDPVKPAEVKADDKTPVVELTDEEIEAAQEQFLTRFYPHHGKEPSPETVKAEEKPAPEPVKEPKPKEKPQEKPKEEPKKETPPPIDEFISKRRQPVVPEPPAPTEPAKVVPVELTEKDKKYIAVLEQMAKEKPTQYGDIAVKHMRYLQKEEGYIRKWLEDNPGEEFNSEDEQHSEWYQRNEVKFDQEDFDEAHEAILEERILSKAKREAAEQKRKMDIERKLRESERDLNIAGYEAFVGMASEMDESIKQLMTTDEQGHTLFPKESQDKLKSENPAAHAILMEEVEPLVCMVQELKKYETLQGDYRPDQSATVYLKESDRLFPVHREMARYIIDYEDAQLKRPAEETLRDGKRLISNEVLMAHLQKLQDNKSMSEDDKRVTIQAIYDNFYVLNHEDYRRGLVEKFAGKAKMRLSKLSPSKRIEVKSEKEAEQANTTKPPVKSHKPYSPTTATVSDRKDTTARANNPADAELDAVVNRIMGRIS